MLYVTVVYLRNRARLFFFSFVLECESSEHLLVLFKQGMGAQTLLCCFCVSVAFFFFFFALVNILLPP